MMRATVAARPLPARFFCVGYGALSASEALCQASNRTLRWQKLGDVSPPGHYAPIHHHSPFTTIHYHPSTNPPLAHHPYSGRYPTTDQKADPRATANLASDEYSLRQDMAQQGQDKGKVYRITHAHTLMDAITETHPLTTPCPSGVRWQASTVWRATGVELAWLKR
ncbi:hypothetical protein EDB80DRAFT_696533 [Ilyonectria destructans]|nr:hypothetical protein EDB80DRAFT_696533 [Ilyonectria destructans]